MAKAFGWVLRRYELFSYQTFIFYTVVTSVVALDRVTLKKKVVDAPEILTVIGQMPHLAQVRLHAPDASRGWSKPTASHSHVSSLRRWTCQSHMH